MIPCSFIGLFFFIKSYFESVKLKFCSANIQVILCSFRKLIDFRDVAILFFQTCLKKLKLLTALTKKQFVKKSRYQEKVKQDKIEKFALIWREINFSIIFYITSKLNFGRCLYLSLIYLIIMFNQPYCSIRQQF